MTGRLSTRPAPHLPSWPTYVACGRSCGAAGSRATIAGALLAGPRPRLADPATQSVDLRADPAAAGREGHRTERQQRQRPRLGDSSLNRHAGIGYRAQAIHRGDRNHFVRKELSVSEQTRPDLCVLRG